MVKPILNFYINKVREEFGILMKGDCGDTCRVEGNISRTKAAFTQTKKLKIKLENLFSRKQHFV